jgi:hypothetical protein
MNNEESERDLTARPGAGDQVALERLLLEYYY